jgi:hypothetical protein
LAFLPVKRAILRNWKESKPQCFSMYIWWKEIHGFIDYGTSSVGPTGLWQCSRRHYRNICKSKSIA